MEFEKGKKAEKNLKGRKYRRGWSYERDFKSRPYEVGATAAFFGVPCLRWWAAWNLKREEKKMEGEKGENIEEVGATTVILSLEHRR